MLVQAQTVLVLGDSISAAYKIPVESGWVNLLSQRLEEKYPGIYHVINASISGDTTAGGLSRLPALLEQYQPNILVVELGGNDGLRGLPLSRMKTNLQGIIDRAHSAGANVMLVSVNLPVSYGAFFNQRFSQVFSELAQANDLPMATFGFGVLRDQNLVQEDGIHPTEKAQPLLLEAVWPYLPLD